MSPPPLHYISTTQDRLNRLNAVVMEVASERSQRFLGRNLEVLVEGVNPRNPAQAFGRSRHNKLVYFDGDGQELVGRKVVVRIDTAHAYSLFGDVVDVVAPLQPLAWEAGGRSTGPVLAAA